jgi:hypothetical protein
MGVEGVVVLVVDPFDPAHEAVADLDENLVGAGPEAEVGGAAKSDREVAAVVGDAVTVIRVPILEGDLFLAKDLTLAPVPRHAKNSESAQLLLMMVLKMVL